MNFLDFLKNNVVIFDGGMGTLLQSYGLKAGESPERLNITRPDIITEIQSKYYAAGSNVVTANTFGANTLHFSESELEEIVKAAFENAKKARNAAEDGRERFIALDIGPLGKMLKPLGELDFEDAVSVFAKTVKLGVKYGADLIIIETMNDCYETKAALLAAKEQSNLPVIVSNAYGADGRLLTGASPEAMIAMTEGMGADVIGANCSFGPKQLIPIIKELLQKASIPVIAEPNAGMPKVVNGKTVFDVSPKEFAEDVYELVKSGARIVGGCCGTTPEHIKELVEKCKGLSPVSITEKNNTVVSSCTTAVGFGKSPVLIGERINPTGKKRLKQAITENDISYILSEGIGQAEKGAHILDVNVGMPGIDEKEMLKTAVCELQTVCGLPLQIDTADVFAMEASLRRYNGKAMINSVNGKKESMEAIFPLAKKYGGVIVALTLDENGIPATAEGRVEIAKKIIATAKEYGIDKKDLVFDTLAMTVSADNNAAQTTLEALRRIKNELGCHTSLGVSNVSFGLPNRDAINSIFFAMALENGLSAAILNPYSSEMMKCYYSYKALKGQDENCGEYIAKAQSFTYESVSQVASNERKEEINATELQGAIIKGLKDKAKAITAKLLETEKPLDIVNNEIIPALNTVGKNFENKKVYLPELLMSADAAKYAFEAVKEVMGSRETEGEKKTFVIATVEGDIHDIGKNIVKLLLENYGFYVVDLGKDVPPEKIVDTVITLNARVCGLSALMTTTVPAMEETIKLLREKAPWCKIVVGGAVLTEEYARRIGADKYCADAMETVRYAEEIFK